MIRQLLLLLSVAVLLPAISAAAADLPPLEKKTAEQVSYHRDVWPILKRHCWGCHSGGMAKGGLSLDSVSEMMTGGDSGSSLTKGKPDESLLIEMIVGEEPEMPPKRAPLSMAKIQILRQWIFAGAQDDTPPRNSDVVTIPKTYRHAPAVTSVALSADGKRLAAACRSEAVIITLDDKAPPRRLPTQCDQLTQVEFSSDGKLLVAAGGTPAQFGEVRLFNAIDGKQLWSRRMSHDTLLRGEFSPDGKTLAFGATDGAVYLLATDNKTEPRRLELHSDWVFDVTFSPNGKLLVTGGRDKSVKVSSLESGKLIRSVGTSPELISSVASSNAFAVAAGRARSLIGYEYKIALSESEFQGNIGNGSKPVDRRAQYTKAFEGQAGEVLALATSGDRKTLAVAGTSNQVRIYEIDTRRRITQINGVAAPVYCVAMNADGTRLAVGSYSGQVQVYELPTGKLLKSLVPVPVATAK